MNGGMSIEQAQSNMRHAYYGGAAGIAVSGLVWLITAGIAFFVPPFAIFSLFVGGMLIHPGAIFLSKLLGRPGMHEKGNPLAQLAVESTIWLLLSIGVAFLASTQRAEWFFIAMMLTIAGRYFTFATLYGNRLFWACGATLAVGAFALAGLNAPTTTIVLTGGIVELVFAAVVFRRERSQGNPPAR
jgi:hypothetical protein